MTSDKLILGALVTPGLHPQAVVESLFTTDDCIHGVNDSDEMMDEDSRSLDALSSESSPTLEHVQGSPKPSGMTESEQAARHDSRTPPAQDQVIVDLTLDSDEATGVPSDETYALCPESSSASFNSAKRTRNELEDDQDDCRGDWRTLKKELYDTISKLRNTVRDREHRIDELEDAVKRHKGARLELQKANERLRKERDHARHVVATKQNDLAYANRQCKHFQGELESTKELLKNRTEELTVAQAFMTTADLYSVSDVCLAVEQLNEEIYQYAVSFADTVLQYREKASTESPERSQQALDFLTEVYGQNNASRLQSDISEGDTVLLESMVQNFLIGQCSGAFQTLCPRDTTVDRALSSLREKILQSHEPAIARNWVAMMISQFRDAQSDLAAACHLLTKVMLAAGLCTEETDSIEHEAILAEKYEEIIKRILKIREMAVEGVLSQEIEVFNIESDTPFAPDIMQDAFDLGKGRTGGAFEGAPEKIICTTAMGVRRVKRKSPSNSSGPKCTTDVILKPKVLLSSSVNE